MVTPFKDSSHPCTCTIHHQSQSKNFHQPSSIIYSNSTNIPPNPTKQLAIKLYRNSTIYHQNTQKSTHPSTTTIPPSPMAPRRRNSTTTLMASVTSVAVLELKRPRRRAWNPSPTGRSGCHIVHIFVEKISKMFMRACLKIESPCHMIHGDFGGENLKVQKVLRSVSRLFNYNENSLLVESNC